MKDKTKELIETAIDKTVPYTYTTLSNKEVVKIMECLTELVVKECCDVLLKWEVEPFPFDEKLAVSIIKEHFEVKS